MAFECIKPEDNRLTSLDKEVYILVHKYQAIKTPRTVIHLSKTPGYRELFNHVFEYHIGLIKTRSQSFEDCQITVYDKALLILTDNGSSLSHFGAIELFKDEILGIRKDDDMGRLDALFSKNIALRAILGHGMFNISRSTPIESTANTDFDDFDSYWMEKGNSP